MTIPRGRKRTRGFTVVELLIVVVVIAILAAITIVSFNGIQERARTAKLRSDVQAVARKVQLFHIDHDAYPDSISDCPTPASGNLCMNITGGDTYNYRASPAGGLTYYTTNVTPGYEITAFGSDQFLYYSIAERTGTNEFMQYMDMGPIIDRYGLRKYQISFDIKSANPTNIVRLYFQNGSTTRYGGLGSNIPVTTSYVNHTVTFTPTVGNMATSEALMAFYGTYNTGNVPTVKNLTVQIAP